MTEHFPPPPLLCRWTFRLLDKVGFEGTQQHQLRHHADHIARKLEEERVNAFDCAPWLGFRDL
jgi:hypothetical protein